MSPDDQSQRWLLLVHQLPSQPSKLRVKVWRRLQRIGSVLVKNAVYVLPNSSETREDLEWIRGEIVAQGGEAVLFTADAVDDVATDEVVDAFVTARRSDWEELRERATALLERHDASADEEEGSREQLEREVKALRNRAAQIDKIDFFQAPGRHEALAAVEAVAVAVRPEPSPPSEPTLAADDFRGRRWLTRPRPGVDRMASAWLIRRFIDPDAAFSFAEQVAPNDDAIPFDMFGVDFGHHDNRCTFETLLQAFGLDEPPLARIARIVHDLDLRSESPTDSATSTIGRLVDGLREAEGEDPLLLERGMVVFEALYRSFRSESGRNPP